MGAVGQLPSRRRSRYASVRAAALSLRSSRLAPPWPTRSRRREASPARTFLVWLKANAGTNTTTDNAPVDIWNDQSNSNNHARQTIATNSRPVFRSHSGNLINFNPVLSFDSQQRLPAGEPRRRPAQPQSAEHGHRLPADQGRRAVRQRQYELGSRPRHQLRRRQQQQRVLRGRGHGGPAGHQRRVLQPRPRSTGPPSSSTTGRWRTSPTTMPRTPTATSTSG